MNPVHELFKNLIIYRDADEALTKRAYQYASTHQDTSLLESIARSVPIGSEIDKLISERTELPILKIWASRPGRSVDEVSKRFAKESRSTLLLDLAGLEDMPSKFYEDLAKRKSIHLAWKLIGNPSVSYSLKEKLAVSLGKNTNVTNRSIYDRIRPLATLDASLVMLFLENNSNEKALRGLSDFATSRSGTPTSWDSSEKSAIMIKIFDTLTKIIKATPNYYASWELRNLTSSLFNYGDYTESDLDILHRKLESFVTSLDTDSELYSIFKSISTTIAKRKETDFDKILNEIALADSPSAINNAVQNYRSVCYSLNTEFDHDASSRLVLANPNIDAATFRSYSRAIDRDLAETIVTRAINNKDAELCGEVFSRSYSTLGADLFSEFFAKADDPNEFVYFLLGESSSAPYYMTSSQAFSANVDLAFKFLPASTVLRGSQYASKVSAILQESLGDDQQAWDTFTSLAGEWSGSFNDLLQVASNLTPS